MFTLTNNTSENFIQFQNISICNWVQNVSSSHDAKKLCIFPSAWISRVRMCHITAPFSFRVHFPSKCCCNLIGTHFIQTAVILLNSVPNVAPLHYELIQPYPRIRLFLSSFLNSDQICTKTVTIHTHKAIFETKQNVLLAKRSRNTDFLPYF